MSYSYNLTTFYVRECYDQYYNYIIKLLKEKRYLSVTGTPSFLHIFFQRYREVNQDQTIATFSFSKDRQLEECTRFGPKKDKQNSDELETGETYFKNGKWIKSLSDDEDSLYLFEGPLNLKPIWFKMVCFTSPNESWLK